MNNFIVGLNRSRLFCFFHFNVNHISRVLSIFLIEDDCTRYSEANHGQRHNQSSDCLAYDFTLRTMPLLIIGKADRIHHGNGDIFGAHT